MAMTGDYISGIERTAACEGWPNDRRMGDGDPVICDLSPRAHGYWGDSCNTLFVGGPPSEFARPVSLRRAGRPPGRGEHTARSAGVKVADEVQQVIEAAASRIRCTSGTASGPRFTSFRRSCVGEPALLEPGMVLMMEPGAYRAGVGGARLEWMFEVTETGNRILTDFEFDLGS